MQNNLYKGRYAFAFYDKTDEFLIDIIDNARDICIRRGIEPTRKNMVCIHKAICIAIKSGKMTEVYDGKTKMNIHLIDVSEEE